MKSVNFCKFTAHCPDVLTDISRIPDFKGKFWVKRCGLSAGVYSKGFCTTNNTPEYMPEWYLLNSLLDNYYRTNLSNVYLYVYCRWYPACRSCHRSRLTDWRSSHCWPGSRDCTVTAAWARRLDRWDVWGGKVLNVVNTLHIHAKNFYASQTSALFPLCPSCLNQNFQLDKISISSIFWYLCCLHLGPRLLQHQEQWLALMKIMTLWCYIPLATGKKYLWSHVKLCKLHWSIHLTSTIYMKVVNH